MDAAERRPDFQSEGFTGHLELRPGGTDLSRRRAALRIVEFETAGSVQAEVIGRGKRLAELVQLVAQARSRFLGGFAPEVLFEPVGAAGEFAVGIADQA